MSVEEYLAGEKDSPVRHEYIDGQVYAMAGASDRHNRIALNLASRLNDHLAGGPCEVFISDMKLQNDEKIFYYPDVVVTCDPAGADAYYRREPRLIVEVISPSTERIDRHEKMAAYKNMDTLQEYVLVMQDHIWIEVHRREGDEWKLESYSQADEQVVFDSVGLRMSVEDIYRNVRWGPTDAHVQESEVGGRDSGKETLNPDP